MKIISHRGYWKTPEEKNSITALRRSETLGFGFETDVRDLAGELVISHDCPKLGALRLTELLSALKNKELPLALNIKSDGLALQLKSVLDQSFFKNWFVFDMSIPDMRSYLKCGIQTLSRLSDIETTPIYLESCYGIWLDSFGPEWYDIKTIEKYLAQDKSVFIVSSELHQRDYKNLWQVLKPLYSNSQVYLCTDFPEQAKTFFET